jgi:hypothetical protein
MSNQQEKRHKHRSECAVVIIYDAWGGRFLFQLKDGTYPIPICRNQLTPYGTGIKPELAEEPEQAIERRLLKELSRHVQEEICRSMRYWKPFRLHWEESAHETYVCHTFVMLLTKPYQLEELEYNARSGVNKQGSLEIIKRERVEDMIKWNLAGIKLNGKNHFMGHREVAILEFLKTLDQLGADGFLKKLNENT